MENDSISPSSSESKLPLIVGILGFALGAAGLVLGIKAKGAAQLASDEAALAKTQVSELGATLASKANASDVQALQADLAATKQQTEAVRADFKAGVQLRDEKRAALKNIEERHAELERPGRADLAAADAEVGRLAETLRACMGKPGSP